MADLVCMCVCVCVYAGGGVWVQLLMGGQGAHPRVILALREYIWNALTVSLVLKAFDGTGSLGFPPRHVVYLPG